MTDQLTQQQVNQTAWAACDTFRGVVDAGQYKDYILVLLFLRRGVCKAAALDYDRFAGRRGRQRHRPWRRLVASSYPRRPRPNGPQAAARADAAA